MPFFKDKELKKRIERWFGRQWVGLITFCTRFLTLSAARALGRGLGNLGYYSVLRHRRAAIRNITLIYGKEKSKKELRQIVRRTFVNASRSAWEFLYYYSHSFKAQTSHLTSEVEGLEHLKKAAGRGKGVIGLGAHLGNFILLGCSLDALGFPATSIMRQMKDGKLENVFDEMRISTGQNWIPKLPVSRAIRDSIEWLRQGKILMMYVDQRSGKGVTVDFMGLPTPTPTGAAVFALKTGAAVLPIFNVHNGKDSYQLIIGEEVPISRTGDQRQDIEDNTARFNKVIERYIRQYPDQWFWFHNRWKGVVVDAN
ncbi:MAG: lysophospholipid acyltransferase family protein [Candidatus Omnitrophota bacterium]